MGTLHTFPPRPVAPKPPPLSPAETRRLIEESAQAALDTADHLLAILDRMDGDADHEDGGDAEPSLTAPENHHGSQLVWLRNNGSGQETDTPEAAVPGVVTPAAPLPWSGRGNIVSAAGLMLLEMVAGR